MASLREKVALITGASSGIGAGTARHFASLGSYLALCGRNKDNLERVRRECEAYGLPEDKILLIQGDVTDDDYCRSVLEKTIGKFGQLDVLVNNAGIGEGGSIEKTSLKQYDFIMNTNMRAVYHLTMLAVPHLIKTQGSIVNVSSVNGMRAITGSVVYNLSKAAMDQFTNCIALELAPKKVRVNSVNPAAIITESYKRTGMSEEEYAKYVEHCKAIYPIGRVGEVDEVAKAIAFLASDDSSFITATQLTLTGGRHVMCAQ